MATLSTALSHALSGLRVASGQTALVARNVARANEEGYSRKYAALSTDIDGTAVISSINRNAEKRLSDILNSSISSGEGQKLTLNALERIQQTVGDPEDDTSLSSAINKLQNNLRLLESNPASQTLALGVLSSASNLVVGLKDASTVVSSLRTDADNGMKQSVDTINGYLAQLQTVNTRITHMPASDQGLAEELDKRDQILKSLSSEIGIRTINQPDNGLAVYTDGGVTLFNEVARSVTFSPTPGISGSAAGNAVYVDGVAVLGPGAKMAPLRGKIAALADIRDNIAPAYQNQLDELARGLIVAFAEKDASVTPTLPDATGLFTYAGAPTVPSTATVIPGLARTISVNSAYDPSLGGSLARIRDGGANGAAYNSNQTASPGFQNRIAALISALDAPMQFSPASQLSTDTSVKGFAENSSGWVEGRRADASSKNDYLDAITTRAREALSRATGVNMDDEMAQMLSLERSYQASSKVISIVDQMLASLLESVR